MGGLACSNFAMAVLQATRVGMNAILRYRKAYLQHMAERTGLMPVGREDLGMRDHISAVGGRCFANAVGHMVVDDNHASDIAAILTGGMRDHGVVRVACVVASGCGHLCAFTCGIPLEVAICMVCQNQSYLVCR